ncbi:MAG: cupin domain-containing protein [Deinococcales bacterium]
MKSPNESDRHDVGGPDRETDQTAEPTQPDGRGDTVRRVVAAQQTAASLTELWSPRVIAELDDHYVKVAKVQGSLAWHSHAEEDELFYVLAGALRIEMEDGDVELREGDVYVVPRGVRHNPVADRECLLMLVERASTLHTGDVITERTRSIEDQKRPL